VLNALNHIWALSSYLDSNLGLKIDVSARTMFSMSYIHG